MASNINSYHDGIRESVDGLPFVLQRTGRRFIQEGALERLLDRSVKCSYYIYLFSDIIIYAQRRKKPPHKYIRHKYLANCLFVDYADSSKGLRYAFEIKNLDDKKVFEAADTGAGKGGPQEKEEWVFLAKNLDQKNGWKRDIEKQINFAADQERVVSDMGSGAYSAFGAYVSGFTDPEGLLSRSTASLEIDDGVSTANVSPTDVASSMSDHSPPTSTISTTPDNWSATSSFNDALVPEEDETSYEDTEDTQTCTELCPKSVIMDSTDDGQQVVRAATIHFIMWYLVCSIDHSDESLIQSFLFSYRAYNSALELLEILKDIYFNNKPPSELPIKYSSFDTRKRVASFLRIWILKFFEKDFDNKTMYTKSVEFVHEISKAHLADANLVKVAIIRANKDRLAKRNLRRNAKMSGHSRQPSENLHSRVSSPVVGLNSLSSMGGASGGSGSWGNKFIEFNLNAVADYLAWSEHSLFQEVALSEFAKMAWTNPKDSKKLSPNILMSTYKFNQLSQWVSTDIVMSTTPKQRALMIERFVSLANKCVELRNYHTLMEILAGINRGFVDRLKKSWSLVSNSTMIMLEDLNNLMDPKQNFKNYREALRKSTTPCLPYFGMFLRDIVFTEENADKVDGLINFEKIQMIGKIYDTVVHFQRVRYPVCEDTAIVTYFKNLYVMPDEILYQHSRSHEPSARPPIDEST